MAASKIFTMVDIAALVAALGGFAQKQQLVARGARDLDLTLAVRTGEVTRARQGWYTTLAANNRAVQAVRVGGRLTGLALIHYLDGWVIDPPPLHVSVAHNAARMRTPTNRFRPLARRKGVVLHWDPPEVGTHGLSWCVALRDAIRAVILHESFEQAVAVLDWALHSRLMDVADLERLVLTLPLELRAIAEWVDPNCESLPESLSRTRFRIAGRHVTSQVRLETDERIDLVVDGEAGIEVDSRKHHADSFDRDRAKDITITLAEFHGIRPSVRSVFSDWVRVEAAVDVALRRRGVPPPTKVQEFRPEGRRRIPQLRAQQDARWAELLNFRKARE